DQAMAEKLADVKGIFIGDALRESEPVGRGEMFDANIIAFAELKKMVLLRSMDLYCIVVLELVQQLEHYNAVQIHRSEKHHLLELSERNDICIKHFAATYGFAFSQSVTDEDSFDVG